MNGLIYALGGEDANSELATGEVYDPRNNTWKPIADMSTRRWGLGAVSM